MVNVKLSVLWTYCVSCKYKTYVSLYKGRGMAREMGKGKGKGKGGREGWKGGLEGRVGREGWKGRVGRGGGLKGRDEAEGGKDGFMASTSITWVCCPLVWVPPLHGTHRTPSQHSLD